MRPACTSTPRSCKVSARLVGMSSSAQNSSASRQIRRSSGPSKLLARPTFLNPALASGCNRSDGQMAAIHWMQSSLMGYREQARTQPLLGRRIHLLDLHVEPLQRLVQVGVVHLGDARGPAADDDHLFRLVHAAAHRSTNCTESTV